MRPPGRPHPSELRNRLLISVFDLEYAEYARAIEDGAPLLASPLNDLERERVWARADDIWRALSISDQEVLTRTAFGVAAAAPGADRLRGLRALVARVRNARIAASGNIEEVD